MVDFSFFRLQSNISDYWQLHVYHACKYSSCYILYVYTVYNCRLFSSCWGWGWPLQVTLCTRLRQVLMLHQSMAWHQRVEQKIIRHQVLTMLSHDRWASSLQYDQWWIPRPCWRCWMIACTMHHALFSYVCGLAQDWHSQFHLWFAGHNIVECCGWITLPEWLCNTLYSPTDSP